MNKQTTVGIVTIGQSPREDVVPEIKKLAGVEAKILECGALDGLSLSEIERLAPEQGDYVLVTRLKDGAKVRLARNKLIEKMQKCIDSLAGQGADLIIILCVGEWPKFRSQKLVVMPSELICGFTLGLMGEGGKLGVIVPTEDQIDDFKRKWSKEGVEVSVVAASAYGSTAKDESTRAADRLKESGVDLVVMDCPGYSMEVKRIVQQVTGKPVMLMRSAVAAMIRGLVS